MEREPPLLPPQLEPQLCVAPGPPLQAQGSFRSRFMLLLREHEKLEQELQRLRRGGVQTEGTDPTPIVPDERKEFCGEDSEINCVTLAVVAAGPMEMCSCGNTFLEDATFCRKCGQNRPGFCRCGNALVPDATFCNKCGSPCSQVQDRMPSIKKQTTNVGSRTSELSEIGQQTQDTNRMLRQEPSAVGTPFGSTDSTATPAETLPCEMRDPVEGDQVLRQDGKMFQSLGGWYLLPGETAEVVDFDDHANFHLVNPRGEETKKFQSRTGFLYQHKTPQMESEKSSEGITRKHARKKKKRVLTSSSSAELAGETSCWSVFIRIANSHSFEALVSVVIIVNVTYMGWATNYMMAHPDNPETMPMRAVNLVFCAVYTLELAIRMLAFGKDFFLPPDRSWNLFDTILVLQSYVEQAFFWFQFENALGGSMTFLRALRLGKLVKMLRVIRLMRSMREMRLILYSIMGSISGMFWSLILIACVLFLFSLVFVQACADAMADGISAEKADLILRYFATVELGMGTLFLSSTGGIDWEVVANVLADVGSFYYMFFCLYIAFFLCVLMNTITALFVESTFTTANKDHQYNITSVLEKKVEYVESLKLLFAESDLDGDGMVSDKEFRSKIADPKMHAFAESLGIEISDASGFFRILTEGGTTNIDLDAFVDSCIRMKGQAQSIDLQDLIMQHKSAARDHAIFARHVIKHMANMEHKQSTVSEAVSSLQHVMLSAEERSVLQTSLPSTVLSRFASQRSDSDIGLDLHLGDLNASNGISTGESHMITGQRTVGVPSAQQAVGKAPQAEECQDKAQTCPPLTAKIRAGLSS